jgi:hypothetical protein
MTKYLIEQGVISGVILLVYLIWYRHRDQLSFNRAYLNVGILLSILIPLIHIPAFPKYIELKSNLLSTSSSFVAETVQEDSLISWVSIYCFIALLCLSFTIANIIRTYLSMRTKHSKSQQGDYFGKPMSFLEFIAVPDTSDKIVLAHEAYHVSAKHSFDRILFSLIHSLLWINPLILLYKKYLIENHEFAADDYSIKYNQIEAHTYGEHLINLSINNQAEPKLLALPNYYHSLLLNRIQMLSTKKSTSKTLNFLGLLLFIALFSSFSLESYTVSNVNSMHPLLINDTIPGRDEIINIDTVSVFNSETKKEYRTIVKSTSKSLDDYLKTINYSGDMITRKDTILSFNYKTYEEKAKVVSFEYPVEIHEFLRSIPYEHHDLIIKKAKELMPK